jgi:chaperonin GroEL
MADRNFNSIQDLIKPLELALESSKPLLVVANEIDGDALQGIVVNKTKGVLRICAIKSPGFGNGRHEMLIDLQSVLGGTVLGPAFDMSEFTIEDFGRTKRAIIHKNMTMLLADSSELQNERIQNRVTGIKKRLNDPTTEGAEKDLLTYRLQQLSGGISILRVGAATESELIERYDRVDDALHATKAALQEGVLPGGGVALVRSSKTLARLISTKNSPSFNAGVNIMKRAVLEPFKQIINNGSASPDSVLESILNTDDNIGYDARNNKITDMYTAGILDPHKVVRCALQNAVSAASMLLSVGCCMIDIEKQVVFEDN